MCWQFGQQSAVGANGVQSALFWCRGAQSARAAYPPIFVLPQVPAAPRTLSCEDCTRTVPRTFPCAHTGSVPCLLEVRVGLQAFPGSLARPKSTPSVFLILRQPGGLHSQPFSTILNHSHNLTSQLQVCTHPLPSYKVVKVVKVDKAPQAPSCTHSQDHVSAVHGVPEIAASLRLHFMPGFNVCSCGPGQVSDALLIASVTRSR